mmetsp:Transcript_57803/g.154105  ORF Transcript_57803/g.154105 Transcript_57803/m.154105 type:complete len:97 (+) Transcript_57803:73-363(+)
MSTSSQWINIINGTSPANKSSLKPWQSSKLRSLHFGTSTSKCLEDGHGYLANDERRLPPPTLFEIVRRTMNLNRLHVRVQLRDYDLILFQVLAKTI